MSVFNYDECMVVSGDFGTVHNSSIAAAKKDAARNKYCDGLWVDSPALLVSGVDFAGRGSYLDTGECLCISEVFGGRF